MSAQQATTWFWSDWAGDRAVRRLTPAERGLWIDLLSFAAVGSPAGYVCDDKGNPISYEELARFTNATPTEVEALINGIVEKGAASRDRTGRLFNRRMVRQAELSVKRKRSASKGGEATKLKWQAFQSLPRQNAQHLPRSLLGARSPPLSNSKTINSSSEAAPAKEETTTSETESPLVASLNRLGNRRKAVG